MARWQAPLALTSAIVCAAMGSTISCSSDESGVAENAGGSSASGGAGAAAGSGGSGAIGGQNNGPFSDFPATPELESGLPSDLPGQFSGSPGQPSGGPCLSEPPLDALVPSNWTPLRFEWSAPAEQNVFELRFDVDNQINDLVIYTTQKSYTVPDSIWKGLTEHSAGHDIKVTLRGARLDNGVLSLGPLVGAEGPVHLAPVAAPGSVVYWTTGAPGTGATALNGFTIGDKSVSTVLTPTTTGNETTCIGCHTSAPDGELTFFTRDTAAARAVDARSVDGTASPPSAAKVSAIAAQLLARNKQTAPVLSAAHYSATDAVALAVLSDASTNGRYELAWTDLHATDAATGWGILARSGDPRQAATPTWWHDGTTIAYTSSASVGEGVISAPDGVDPAMDIYTVPYNNRAGGTATPLSGASDPSFWEFYPVISPDDALLAFNRAAPVAGGDSYDEPTAEVYVVPAGGGSAVRLASNDPPACTGKTSPGLTNSWPRWAPAAGEHAGKRYYWIIFSSKRRDPGHPQLYISGVVTTLSGGTETIEKTYPGLYVTSQIAEEANHTPAWDVFKVKPPT